MTITELTDAINALAESRDEIYGMLSYYEHSRCEVQRLQDSLYEYMYP